MQDSEEHDVAMLKELRESWYTKGELKEMKDEIESPQRTTSHDNNKLNLNPITSQGPA